MMVNKRLILVLLIVGSLIVSACNFAVSPPDDKGCKSNLDCGTNSFCSDAGCVPCPVVDCPSPKENCHYETTKDSETGCENACGKMVCAEPEIEPSKAILKYDFTKEQSKMIKKEEGSLSGFDLVWSRGDHEWVKRGLWIAGDTILKADSKDLYKELVSSGKFSVEVYFEPDNLEQTGPARIITLSKDASFRDFTLGQVGDGLQFRVRTANTDLNGGPAKKRVEVDNVLEEKPVHVVGVYDGSKSILYVDGKKVGETTIGGDLQNWEPYEFAFGNELDIDSPRPWAGTLYEAAIYNFALDDAQVEELYKNR